MYNPEGISGLSFEKAKELKLQHGSNEVIKTKKLSVVSEFFGKFANPLFGVLIGAAIISLFFGEWLSAVTIIAMVFLSGVLDFVNTFRSKRAAELLREKVKTTVTVLRGEKECEVGIAELVPGDIVHLEAGNLVPADGVVETSKDFYIDESSFTGESYPLFKEKGARIFMGTNILSGEGLFRVTETGRRVKFSHIADSLTSVESSTDFDRGIRDFSMLVMKVIFVLVIFVFFVNAITKGDILQSFLFAAALAVGIAPELLPMVIAVNLSKGSLLMARHGVIVKKLSAIQSFGSMDILCTDKTGTLTEDKITLIKHVNPFGKDSKDVLEHAYREAIFGSGMKNPLNSAILEYKKMPVQSWKKIDEIPFDFMRKRDSVILEHDQTRLLLTKGAPEDIMNQSVCCETEKQKFTKQLRSQAEETYKTLSEQGFRVLGLASKKLKKKDEYSKEDEHKLTFLGFIAFFDPPKKTAKDTLKRLSEYGVGIKIITGDNDLVTKKVAAEINLPIVGTLTGSQVLAMSDQELRKKVEETNLFSRITPDQKTRIIKMLQANGHVVGYLGDGINDAPSLKAADVSISVNNAVDIAKESADMILMKKSLGDLVNGVREGRKTFMNTMKYLMMELSSNFGNMFSMAGASFFLPFLPMLPAQILLNNMLYDISQFSLSLDNVDEDSIRAPKKMNIGFLKKFMITFGPVSSLFDFLTFGVLYWGFHLSGAGFQTGWFLESLVTQTFVVYVIRTRYFPSGKHAPSLPVLISTIGVVVLGFGIALSFLGSIFGFVAVPLWALLAIAGITIGYVITIEFVKQMFYKKHAI